jgi:hypothetical protein
VVPCSFSGGGASGVASINSTTGAFTFNGPGVNCVTTTCTFTGAGSFPTGATNQMLYYAANGTAVSVLTLGTNLSITSGVLNATGGGTAPLLATGPAPLNTTAIQAIPRAGTAAVNGVFTGDSFNICDHNNCSTGPVVSTNRIPEQIRINYQALYGNGGTGIVPLIHAFAASPAAVNPEAWAVAGTYDTVVTALGPTQNSQGTLVHLATTAVATFSDNRSISYNGGNLYFATSSGSGTITVAVDGTTVGTASASSFTSAGAAASGYTPRVLTVSSFASSVSHSVTFTASGDCYIYGWEGTNGTTGVRIHNVSVGGAQAASVGVSAAAQNAFTDLIPSGVQFETLAFLTNDAAASVATGTFSSNLTNTINHFQALSSHPTVVLVVPPVDIINGTDAEAAYTAIITGLGTSLNVTTVNMQSQGATVGGTFVGFGTATPLSTNNWFDWSGTAWPGGNAGVHPSDIGAAVEAQLESAAILNPAVVASSGGGCSTGCTLGGLTTLSGGSLQVVSKITNTGSGGPVQELLGTGTGVDIWGTQSASSADSTTTGGHAYLVGDFTTGVYSSKSTVSATGAGVNELPSLNVECWSSGISVTLNNCDTGISRVSADVVAFGNGAQGDATATLNAANLALSGNATNTVNTGTASVNTVHTSASAAGTVIELTGTGTNIHLWGIQTGVGSGAVAGDSQFQVGDFSTGIYGWAEKVTNTGGGYNAFPSLSSLCWSSTASVTTVACDTGLSRISAGLVGVGTGAQGNTGGTLKLAAILPSIYSAAGTALPTCASGIKGQMSVVSDATSPTYMGAYTSGGGITAAVICSYNGTTYNWLTH